MVFFLEGPGFYYGFRMGNVLVRINLCKCRNVYSLAGNVFPFYHFGRSTVCIHGQWADVDSAWEQKNSKPKNCSEMAANPQPSIFFVGRINLHFNL